jgi:hypothetical protein
MKKVIGVIVLVGVVFFFSMNTGLISDKAVQWVDAHPTSEDAPKVLLRAGNWARLLGDGANAERLFMLLYQKYPQENALAAEGLYHIAEIREQGAARMSCLDFCRMVMDQYPAEEKWRTQASQLYDQVKNNAR